MLAVSECKVIKFYKKENQLEPLSFVAFLELAIFNSFLIPLFHLDYICDCYPPIPWIGSS